jgi:hypothetical protein
MSASQRSSLLLGSETGSYCLSSEAEDLAGSSVLYFAFGSNLNTQRIRINNPSARYCRGRSLL